MGMRDIANYINKLVSKGKLDRKYHSRTKKITRVKQDKDVKDSPGQNQQSIMQRVLVVKICQSLQNNLEQDILIKNQK